MVPNLPFQTYLPNLLCQSYHDKPPMSNIPCPTYLVKSSMSNPGYHLSRRSSIYMGTTITNTFTSLCHLSLPLGSRDNTLINTCASYLNDCVAFEGSEKLINKLLKKRDICYLFICVLHLKIYQNS